MGRRLVYNLFKMRDYVSPICFLDTFPQWNSSDFVIVYVNYIKIKI